MDIQGSVAFVTGANRGLGAEFARRLLEQGASRVYAGVRQPASITDPDIVPVRLDVTSPDDIAAAVAACADVTLLVNNAGIAVGGSLLGPDALDAACREMNTNVWGPFALSTGFAPVLAANGGGAIVNVLSVLSWLSLPGVPTYSMSKAAAWSLTNGLRVELAQQGTLVVGVHAGFIDTDMAAHVDQPKIAPADVVSQVLGAVRDDRPEVLADEITRSVKASLSNPVVAPTQAANT